MDIPVYLGFPPSCLGAKLRYRIQDGALSFMVHLVKPLSVLRACNEDILATVSSKTGIPVFIGEL
jgi:hypothetical protein